DDPAYAKVKKDLHARLEKLRVKYKDNTALSQRYVDEFMKDAEAGKVFGVSKKLTERIKERSKKK
ncbi:MAG TPA: sulfatase, partial [Chryseolinea sp.]